jgi:hypothetical protein
MGMDGNGVDLRSSDAERASGTVKVGAETLLEILTLGLKSGRDVREPLEFASDVQNVTEAWGEKIRGAVGERPRDGHAEKYGQAIRLDTLTEPEEPRCVSTGIPDLDAIIGGGLAHRRLLLLVGDVGSGKTRMPLFWYAHAARAGYKIVLMSTELTAEDVRLILTVAGFEDVLGNFYVLYGADITEFTLALSAAVEDSPDGKVIGAADYCQMIEVQRQDGRVDLGLEGIANHLAHVANMLDVPTVLTSQTSRTALKRGADVHAAASGNLERAASAMLLAVPVSETEVELTCHKLRWGRKGGKVLLSADWRMLTFTPAAPIAGAPKSGKLSTRDLLAETIIRVHGEKHEGPTKEMLAGLLDLSEDAVYRHAKALTAVGRIRTVEGCGPKNPTRFFPPEATL